MKKKPEVGQWWVNVVGDPPRVHKTGIVLFVGRDSKKRLLWEDCQGHIETDYNLDWSNWHHEPACTGWDWVPEVKEEFPQWYSYKTGPFESNNDPYLVRVDSAGKQSLVHRSGKVDNVTYPYKPKELVENVRSGAWKRLSQQEADEALHPKESFPQWYVPRNPNEVCESFKKPIAYYRRDSAKKGETFYTDGESFKWGYWEEDLKNELVPCSQADAEARVTKKPTLVIKAMPKDVAEPAWANAESPDGWVTQDRVPARKSIDQYRYIWRSGKASAWDSYDWPDVKHHVHGYTDDVGDRMEVRCRRKDLPVVEAKTTAKKTASVTVYEVVYGDNLELMNTMSIVGDRRLADLSSDWKYFSVVSTKTVEVML